MFNTKEELNAWLKTNLNLTLPENPLCDHHDSPLDYLWAAYHEPASDLVVWAPRGGGKTRLAAVATLLDLLHKPQVSIRILGGSLEQSLRVWEHLLPDIETVCPDLIDGKLRARRFQLTNRASAGVVTQSQTSVRGLRVQKLRCDEVDLFEPPIWEAAQLVTRSLSVPGETPIAATIEALSTCQNPGGLMESIIERCENNPTGPCLIKWCILDVLENCPPERVCETCALLEDCNGKAKFASGFVSIDDAIRMKQRVNRETWLAEMLCERPSRSNTVFPEFDPKIHVRPDFPEPGRHLIANPRRNGLYCGVDFGIRNPFVCLWIMRDDWGRSLVIDEYVKQHLTIYDHIHNLKQKPFPKPRKICCDPAGDNLQEGCGESNVDILRAAGFSVTHKRSLIPEGVQLIRAQLKSATGETSLFIHPRCRELIKSLRTYRYGQNRSESPAKDGPDHAADALRYYYIARDTGEVEVRAY